MTTSAPAISTTKILVVDDDHVAAESLADYLAEEGYHAVAAFSPDEALERLSRAEHEPADGRGGAIQSPRPFGVVISDVAMPGMTKVI